MTTTTNNNHVDIDSIDLTDETFDFSTLNLNPSITINTTTANNTISGVAANYIFSTNHSSGLHVTADAVFEGDLKVKGVSILEVLEKIQNRLAVLVPNPAKLEQFEALKKAYDHYKLLESLCDSNFKKEE